MNTLSKTQVAALKAAEAGDGKLVKFGFFYWKASNHKVNGGDRIPDQKVTFGTKTINVLRSLGYLDIVCDAYITELGRAALAEMNGGAK